ncbi:MAG: ATP-dependent zinc metalloprotease FtsH [Planctomycetota bacterium]|nr:ATP-dependent zinc metalloprotease FtsH [Planctomycetota bacterium]
MPEEPANKPPEKRPVTPVRFGRNMMWWVVFGLIAVLLMSYFMQGIDQRVPMSQGEFWGYAKRDQVKELLIKTRDGRLEGELIPNIKGRAKDAKTRFYVIVDFNANKEFLAKLYTVFEGKRANPTEAPPPGWFARALPYIALYGGLLLLLWFFLFRRIGQMGGGAGFLGQFGRSKHRLTTKEHTNVNFNDVAGIDEAKGEVAEIIEFLKNPKKFRRLGGRIPRGILLVGEPGCGKTLLAKAIAGEADVPFFSISGSDFVEMFVGVGASRVRDLFRQAKESAPCIIFLDEIDAVGRRRGAGFNGGGHDEREQTLNAILVEMDGFETNDQVIVIAATNRMDVLDPALTRPGRFDRQIQVPLPDIKGRAEILKIYAAKVECGPDVDLHRLARGTPMFSGADLEALINEAAIAATMANKDTVEQADLEEARDKVRWGRARKSRAIDEREKEMTAYHEAGHALVQVLNPDADPLHKVSIIPRGQMGGGTFSLPEKDRYMFTRRWCEAFIRVAVAGRIAEEMFCGDIDSGAAADIAQSTELARKMILEWGMSEKLSFVRYTPGSHPQMMFEMGGKDYSEKTAEVIDEEIKVIMYAAYKDAGEMLQANRDKVRKLAEALLKYETLDVSDVEKIIAGETLDKPSINELLEAEAAQTAPVGQPSPPAKTDQAPHAGAIPEPG